MEGAFYSDKQFTYQLTREETRSLCMLFSRAATKRLYEVRSCLAIMPTSSACHVTIDRHTVCTRLAAAGTALAMQETAAMLHAGLAVPWRLPLSCDISTMLCNHVVGSQETTSRFLFSFPSLSLFCVLTFLPNCHTSEAMLPWASCA